MRVLLPLLILSLFLSFSLYSLESLFRSQLCWCFLLLLILLFLPLLRSLFTLITGTLFRGGEVCESIISEIRLASNQRRWYRHTLTCQHTESFYREFTLHRRIESGIGTVCHSLVSYRSPHQLQCSVPSSFSFLASAGEWCVHSRRTQSRNPLADPLRTWH